MVDFHNRWSPPVVLTRDNIEKGNLGKIISAYVRLNDTVQVPTRLLSWAAKSSVLWFLGSHTVDMLRYLLDDEVERVYAVSRSEVLRGKGFDVPDIYQSILEFKTGSSPPSRTTGLRPIQIHPSTISRSTFSEARE